MSLAQKIAADVGVDAPKTKVRVTSDGFDLFGVANDVDIKDTLQRLGLMDGEQPKCPGCGETDGVAIVRGGLKCLHERCATKGVPGKPGFRTATDLVAEVHGIAPADAAKMICGWLGIDVPGRRRQENEDLRDDDAVSPFGPGDDDPGEPPLGRFDDETSTHREQKFPTIEVIDSAAIFAELEPPDYVIDGVIVRGTIAQIIAYGYSGKSWLGVNAVNSVGAGVPWLERFPTQQGSALLMDWEAGKYEDRRRLKLDALGRDLMTPVPGVALVAMPPLYMTDPKFGDVIERLMDGRALIVFDTLKAATPGADENSSEMRTGLDRMRPALERTGCSALVLAHAKKTSGSATAIDPREAGRGSSAIFDAADTVLHITYTEGEPLRVQQTKARCGKAVEPFLVEILDTENGGVRVVAKDEPANETAHAAGFDELCDRVLEAVRQNIGASGRVVRAKVGGRANDALAALETLERHGAIRNAGSEKAAKWFPVTRGDES